MSSYATSATIEANGHLELDGLPFPTGQMVRVIIAQIPQPQTGTNLHGTVQRYDQPMEPVADADWETAA